MSTWYFERQEIKHSPSFKDGIDSDTEARYRKEGARFINDVGRKLGLRYDTCATGIVYFHRFYMLHSFKEFHRHVMGSACLFLAGKVEETPKKSKDLLKAIGHILSEHQMNKFGEDPKEELMTMERILLQTIKFDLRVDHPYKYVLKYGKSLKGDKSKIDKVVQMSWTFINDSLCTTLCLQWEPEIIAIALMYLACRLSKYDITDWQGRQANQKGKWWDMYVEDISIEHLESICHQVLDFYSNAAPQSTSKTSPGNGQAAKRIGGAADGSVAPPLAKQQKMDTSVGANHHAPPYPQYPPGGAAPFPPVAATSYQQDRPAVQAGYPAKPSYPPPIPSAPYTQQPPASAYPPTTFYNQPPPNLPSQAGYYNHPPPHMTSQPPPAFPPDYQQYPSMTSAPPPVPRSGAAPPARARTGRQSSLVVLKD